MARVRSPEKRSAILRAAVYEIAKTGLGAPTAKIAGRAGVAAGTLFTDSTVFEDGRFDSQLSKANNGIDS
jgi:hypothetical protein